MRYKLFIRSAFFLIVFAALAMTASLRVSADEYETLPPEYSDFMGSVEEWVGDRLPEDVFSNDAEDVEGAAAELLSPMKMMSVLLDSLGMGIKGVAPTLAAVLGIVLLSAVVSGISSACPSISRVTDLCTRLCTFSAISALAVGSAESLTEFFDRLFSAVASFIPLSGVLYAMGGNLTAATSSNATLGVTLAVCQFFFTKTVIPVFCVCLCLSLLSVFEGAGASAGSTVGATLRRWYTTSLSFVMMMLTTSIVGSGILASRADGLAMRGIKFAVSNFVPLSGGTVSTALGTLSASVSLLRSSIGGIGIAVIVLLLLPTVVELALLRGVFAIGSFCASTLGSGGEARLLSELDSLYGYLEGVAVLSSVVFVIAFGAFALTSTPF